MSSTKAIPDMTGCEQGFHSDASDASDVVHGIECYCIITTSILKESKRILYNDVNELMISTHFNALWQ